MNQYRDVAMRQHLHGFAAQQHDGGASLAVRGHVNQEPASMDALTQINVYSYGW